MGRHTYTMSKITEQQLIESLKQMKQIKPRQEWVSLLRSQILSERVIEPIHAQFSFASAISNSFSRRVAYSFATLLLLIAGAFGLVKLLPVNTTPQQTASLTGQAGLSQNVADLNTKIVALKQNLKTTSSTNLQTAKAVADQIQKIKQLQTKTLADVPGTAADKNLNEALAAADSTLAPLVESEINDLQKTTLTTDQQKILAQAQDLYKKADYSGALEQIWNLSNVPNLIDTTSPTN